MNRPLTSAAGCVAMTVLAAYCLAAASPPKTAVQILKVAFWAEPGDGAPLAAKDLRAKLAGAASRVVDVKGPADDLLLINVLDLAGDISLADSAKTALAEEIGKLPPRAEVAVMSAQDGPKVRADPAADRAPALAAIHDQPVSGKAGLLDTVATVTELADSVLAKSGVRVAVLYVTDSEVENYREDFTNPVINSSDSHDLSRRFPEVLIQDKISKMLEVLTQRRAPMFVVHLRYRSDRLGEAYQKGLEQLAEATGGSAIFCRSMEEIADAMHRTVASITSSYSVGLALPEHPPKVVQVQLESAGNASLRYRLRFVVKER
jgi:hypothetical protein